MKHNFLSNSSEKNLRGCACVCTYVLRKEKKIRDERKEGKKEGKGERRNISINQWDKRLTLNKDKGYITWIIL